MNTTRIADLTVDELLTLLRKTMRDIVREAVQEALTEAQAVQHEQLSILDIPPLDLGLWPAGLTLLSREDMYDHDGR